MHIFARMRDEIRDLTANMIAVWGTIEWSKDQLQTLENRDNGAEEVHVPGSFPDAEKEAEAEVRRLFLEDVETRLSINRSALHQLRERRSDVQKELGGF